MTVLESGEEWLNSNVRTKVADKPSSGGDSCSFVLMGLSLLPSHWEHWEEGAPERQKEIDKLIWQHKHRHNGRAHRMKRSCIRQKLIFLSCMELGSFPIQFPIHYGLACLCAEAQTLLFGMSIRNNCVRMWLSGALT